MRKFLAVLLALTMMVTIVVPAFADAQPGGPGTETDPDDLVVGPLQLWARTLEVTGRDEEAEHDIFGVNPETPLADKLTVKQGEETFVVFGTLDEEENFTPIPVERLKSNDGSHLEALAPEFIREEDQEQYNGCAAILTVDDAGADYHVRYDEGNVFYVLDFSSEAPDVVDPNPPVDGPLWIQFVDVAGYDEEMEHDIYAVNPELVMIEGGMDVMPGQEFVVMLGIKDGDSFIPVPVESMEITEGAHLEAVATEFIREEDQEQYSGCIATLTVDEKEQYYQVRYEKDGKLYATGISSFDPPDIIDPNPPVDGPRQLWVNWAVEDCGWNDELQHAMFQVNPDRLGEMNEGFGVMPGQENFYVMIGLQDEEGNFVPVPVEDLKAEEGAHLEALAPEYIREEDRERYAGCIARVTVDDFDAQYHLRYDVSEEEFYVIVVDSDTHHLMFYREPELKNENIIIGNYLPYNVLADEVVFYAAAKYSDEWEGHRRLQSVEMGTDAPENNNDRFTLEPYDDTFWKITLKPEAIIGEGSNLFLRGQWQHEEGEGNWVNDDDFDRANCYVDPEMTMAYSLGTEDLTGGKAVPLDTVKDQLIVDLELEPGQTADITPYYIYWDDEQDGWVALNETAMSMDIADHTIATLEGVDRSVTVTAVKEGVTQIFPCFASITVYKDGVDIDKIPDAAWNSWEEFFAQEFGIGKRGEDWEYVGDVFGIAKLVDGKFTIPIETKDGKTYVWEDVDITRGEINDHWYPPITITVKATPTPTPTPTPPPTVPDFTDVPGGQGLYYYQPVMWAVSKGITGGTGNGSFSPNRTCTRVEIVTFLWNFKDKPAPEKMATFVDMTKNTVFNNAISWAVENQITGGVGNNKFSPNSPCTREQAMTFLWIAAGKPEPTKTATFADMPSNPVFAKAISWAVENNITSGTGKNKFSPKAPCTRAQIVTFLYNVDQLNYKDDDFWIDREPMPEE